MTATQLRADGARARHAWTWLPEDRLEGDALAQVRNIAALPSAVAVAVMPDAHVGYGMPIGTALATENAIVPYAVGVDIGCGMVAIKTDLVAEEVRDRVRDALEAIYRRVPVGLPTRRDRGQGSHGSRQNSEVLREWVDRRGSTDPKAKEIRERADRQLGTLGSGNHFLELQSDGESLWLMFHTGSRSFGKQLCDRHHATALAWCERYRTPLPDKELAFLAFDADEGRAYFDDMRDAMRFAEESRARTETHHNFAAVERHFGAEVVVHRKGAVRTTDAHGEPILVTIPGSMQTGSYIGRGKPSVIAMDTCSHGAEGILLVCPPGSDALDEAGRAYKDIEAVMSLQRDLVEPVVKLQPLGVVKG